MKKIIKIVFVQIIVMFLVFGQVQADSEPCKITVSSSKKILEPEDEITLNIMMSDVTVNDGIKLFLAMVDYDANIFDVEYDESEDALDEMAEFAAATGYAEDSIAVLYLGKNDDEISGNTWNAVAICDDEGKMSGIVAYSTEAEKNTQAIAKVKLIVDEEAESTTTKITLEEMQVSSDGENELELSNDASITYTIEGEKTDAVAGTSSGNNTYRNNNTYTNSTTTENKAPNTGLDDYIFAITIVLLIGFISFIKYREYKDINID